MKKRRTIACLCLTGLLAVAGATQGDARDVVEMRLPGRYYVAPATVRILVAVEPNEENRALVIEADGEQMFRSSELALAGASEKRLHSIEFRNLPAGSYTLRAEVRSAHNVRGSARQDLIVTSVGAE